MEEHAAYAKALGLLRVAKEKLLREQSQEEIEATRDEVLARFGPVFSPARIRQLKEAEVKAFLLFENNKHWKGMQRHSNQICADMEHLRSVLAVLLDESRPIGERLDHAVGEIYGMGKGIATAILQVAYPGKYGVWNAVSEDGLIAVGLWPEFERGLSTGQRYEVVNDTLQALASELGLDLWTLDLLWLWWYLQQEDDDSDLLLEQTAQFALERHLHDFLLDNWETTELAEEWMLFEEDGDPDAGYEYRTDVGRIDLLAHHRHKPEWLVIELKREHTGDATVGQVLRYMGWVKRRLAQPGDSVRGLVIAHEADDSLLYALEAVPSVDMRCYEVNFRLRDRPTLGSDPDQSPG